MAKIFTEADADLTHIAERNVTVLGSDLCAAEHVRCLRDSGVEVRLGVPNLPDQDRTQQLLTLAKNEGIRHLDVLEASEEADTIVVTGDDLADVVNHTVVPSLMPGDILIFTDPQAVRFNDVTLPDFVDVILVSPQAQPEIMRREFTDGRGVPTLVAVQQNKTQRAWQIALSYAAALGSLRVGAFATTFAEAAETAMFGNHIISTGALANLLRAGFDTLVAGGYQPEVAYLQTVHAAKTVVDKFHQVGLARAVTDLPPAAEQTAFHAGTHIIDGHVRHVMASALADVRGGYVAQTVRGSKRNTTDAERNELASHPIEEAGRVVRRRTAWVKSYDASQSSQPR